MNTIRPLTNINMNLQIKTPQGDITAKLVTSEEFPGIEVSINGKAVALVEFHTLDDVFKIHTWQDGQEEPNTLVWTQEKSQTVEELVSLAEKVGLTSEKLDDAVWDLSSILPNAGPSVINNGGLNSQFDFLLTNWPTIKQGYHELSTLIRIWASGDKNLDLELIKI